MQKCSRTKRRHCQQCLDNVEPTQLRRRRRHLPHRWLRRPGDCGEWNPSGSPCSCWEHWRRILVLCGFYLHTLISWPCRKVVEVGVSHLVSFLFGSCKSFRSELGYLSVKNQNKVRARETLLNTKPWTIRKEDTETQSKEVNLAKDLQGKKEDRETNKRVEREKQRQRKHKQRRQERKTSKEGRTIGKQTKESREREERKDKGNKRKQRGLCFPYYIY